MSDDVPVPSAAAPPKASPPAPAPPAPLAEIAGAFLKLGCTAFGGPAAHIAMMEDEFVVRRRWLNRARFLDVLGMVNLVPGPNSSETAMQIGYIRGGLPGLVVAGICFILPAAILTALVAALYGQYQVVPLVAAAFRGIQPIIPVIIAGAILRLAADTVRTPAAAAIAVGAAVFLLFAATPAGAELLPRAVRESPELVVLAAGALFGLIAYGPRGATPGSPPAAVWLGLAELPNAAAPTVADSGSTEKLVGMTLCFLKIGALLFGSGYLLVNFLRADFVIREPRLTESELLDAIAVGQFTPGPVLSAATFVGWRLHGAVGAVAATAAIFLPAFLIMIVLAGRFEKLRASPIPAALLRGIHPVVAGLMTAVLVQIAGSTLAPDTGGGRIIDVYAVCATAVSTGLIFGLRLNPTWLLIPGAGAGVAVYGAFG